MERAGVDADSLTPPELCELGVKFLNAGDLPKAQAAAYRATKLDPSFAQSWKLAAVVSVRLGRGGDALAALTRYCELRPSDAVAKSDLGDLLRQSGKIIEARVALQQAISLNDKLPAAWVNLGACLQQAGSHHEAIDAYAKAIALDSLSAPAHYNLGAAFYELGDLPKAAASFQRAIDLNPQFIFARINLGIALVDQGQIPLALAQGRAVDAKTVTRGFPHHLLGILFARCGDLEAARRQFELALAADPADSAGAAMMLSRIGAATAPDRASDALIASLYRQRAAGYDAPGPNGYHGGTLVADAFNFWRAGRTGLTVLDAGCGTGLVGEKISSDAATIEGVDLSPDMLMQAQRKNRYAKLYKGNLLDFMASAPYQYDAITCAATLIHFGDLSSVLLAASRALRPNGSFIFSVFPNTENPDEFSVAPFGGLAEAGVFVHGDRYLVRTALKSDLALTGIETHVQEYRHGVPRNCLVIVTIKHSGLRGSS